MKQDKKDGEERRGERMIPDLSFADWGRLWGFMIFAMYVSRVCTRVRGYNPCFLISLLFFSGGDCIERYMQGVPSY